MAEIGDPSGGTYNNMRWVILQNFDIVTDALSSDKHHRFDSLDIFPHSLELFVDLVSQFSCIGKHKAGARIRFLIKSLKNCQNEYCGFPHP